MATGFKSGGRQLGTPNKLTLEIREALVSLVLVEIENYADKRTQSDLPGAKYSLDALRVFLPFVLPKPQSNLDDLQPIVITIPANL
jgi:hypothetical protein